MNINGLAPASPASPAQLATAAHWSWRRRLLWLSIALGCLAVFLVARQLAQANTLGFSWRADSGAGMEIIEVDSAELQPLVGARVIALECPGGGTTTWSSRMLAPSERWVADEGERAAMHGARSRAARCIDAGLLNLTLQDGRQVQVAASPRGYAGLGALFWLFAAMAMALWLVATLVPLLHTRRVNVLYGIMAAAQSLQMLLFAIGAAPALAPPSAWLPLEGPLHLGLDLITVAAMTQSVATHPARLRGQRWITALAWLAVVAWAAAAALGATAPLWWWAQGCLLLLGMACLLLLGWSFEKQPHPFVLAMRRLGWAIWLTLALLTLAAAAMRWLPPSMLAMLDVATVLWSVFVASAVLLIPFTARAQSVLREFALVAGVGSVATSLELLFVAVASLSQRTSMTLSIVIALAIYAALRHWLISQAGSSRAATTERMFEHLYRVARDVQTRPERARERMSELLQHVFNPLQANVSNRSGKRSFVALGGSALIVPLPGMPGQSDVGGMVALKYAEQGRRMFEPEDALLADRILEQLMRAMAHDRAVERGRTEERMRIAQDLHDDIGARLLTLMYKAPNREVENYVRHTLQDLKTLTRGLAARAQPLSLAMAEWRADIDHRLEAVACRLDWASRIDHDVVLTSTEWSSLTRIVRELISNAIAHAKATHLHIECCYEHGQFRFVVRDNGNGRNPDVWSHGLGLGGIRKRVKQLSGSVVWREIQPRGIECEVRVPRLSGDTR